MKAELTEDYMVEQSAIEWLKNLGYLYIHGSELSPENGERETYRVAVLKKKFIEAIKTLNSWLTDKQSEEVYKKIIDLEHPDFIIKGKNFYNALTNGVKIKVREKGEDRTKIVKLVDFENFDNNEFLVANQFTVEYQHQKEETRRPDLVVFINGLPIAIFEFKNFNANETAKDAFDDHKRKMNDIPQLYVYAQVLGVSDGLETKHGSTTSDWDRFFIWEGILDDDDLEVKEIDENCRYYIFKETGQEMTSLEILLKGLFRKEHLTEYLQDFVLYGKSGETYIKKIAMFHQFYTTRKAVEKTKKSVLGKNKDSQGNIDRRIGVVWHTQGTGKSLTMLFYAKKTLKLEELENPLLVFITDRNNLDEQLYGVFADVPVAKKTVSIKDLQKTIKTSAGGIIFATIQKFGKKKAEEYPFLTDRENIIVIADEAHRSQYKELAMNLRKAIPNASFMGFTATPIELIDRSTTLVFGDHISVYAMGRARDHNVVVPIFYEARLSKLHLTNEFIDEEFEEISEAVIKDGATKETLKRKYTKIEKLILSQERLEKIAKDIVTHFNKRTQEFSGKAMVVTISRKVAVRLYEKIINQPNAPAVAVVMSGNKNKDPKEFHPHIRKKNDLKQLDKNFKNPDADPQMVIVVDMWLTGSDVPCLNTMYFDKPMKDHSLVQAITRVNRVFKDKPGGLIVDYIGVADHLRKSLKMYTLSTIKRIFVDIREVIAQLKEKFDIVCSLLSGIKFKEWKNLSPSELSRLTAKAYDKISKESENKKMFVRNFVALKKLYALASPHSEAYEIKDDIRFFEMIKKMIIKYSTVKIRDITRDLEYEISQLISKSVVAEEPVDVFSLMGKEKPEISIFDEKFLAQFKEMEYKNYAAELLAKIMRDEITVKMRRNPFRYRSLYDTLKKMIDSYNVKILDTTEVINELIKLAKEIKKAVETGKDLNLSEEELAFYDLLVSKEKFFENFEEIKKVAKEIVKELSHFTKVADWDRKEYLKAKIKASIKTVLIDTIDGRAEYTEIEKLSKEVISHAESIYAFHPGDRFGGEIGSFGFP